jgi:hypothetical protein
VIEWIRRRPFSETRTTALDQAMQRWATLDSDAAHVYLLSVEERETRGILEWAYLRARIGNGAFLRAELEQIDVGYSDEWRERLFAQLAADLEEYIRPSMNARTFRRTRSGRS